MNVGIPGLALCSLVEKGTLYYGTWREGSCHYNNGASGLGRPNGYACACVPPGEALTWAADPGCAAGPASAAEGPAVCRIRKAGGGDFRMG